MWTRDLLKRNAKASLRSHYWVALAVCLVAGLLGGGGTNAIGQLFYTYTDTGSSNSGYGSANTRFAIILVMILAIVGILCVIFALFVGNVIRVGLHRYFMESRLGSSPFATLFSAFGGPHYMNVVKVMFLRDLRVFLWSLLFIIPGIIKSYQYRMVDYLMAENPTMEAGRALALSSQITDGEKGNMFVLDLSFIGWYLLGTLVCGIGTIFVAPYVQATWAEFYAAMRAKVFANGWADSTELGDFYRYGA